MKIDALTKIYNSMSLKGIIDEEYRKPEKASFGDVLQRAIQKVDEEQTKSTKIKQDFILGKVDNIHDVQIQSEKSMLYFQTFMAVRGKVVEAYKEVMRIQL